MAKKDRQRNSSKRAPVESVDQFDAAYLPPEVRGGSRANEDEQIGMGLVTHVLRDFRRNLRS